MASRNAMLSLDAMEDIGTMAEIIGQVVLERRTELLEEGSGEQRGGKPM